MAEARFVAATVLYDGAETGLSKRIKSISYTDNSHGKSDEISLTFDDRDEEWLSGNVKIERGHDLDVSLWFHDWTRNGGLDYYHCGNFTVETMSQSGPPGQCVIKGISSPADSNFLTGKVSRTWQKIRLKQIAEEVKEKYGMKDLFFWGEDPIIEEVQQDNVSDSSFLKDMCSKQGKCLKVYKLALVIFDKSAYEPRPAKRTFWKRDLEQWSWDSTMVGTYTGASLSYTNPKNQKTISVTVGEGPRILTLNERAESEEEALRIAKSKVNEENEKAVTVSFTAMGDANLFATNNFELAGMGMANGKYFVTSVTHSLSGSGHSMKVSGYQIFNRL